MRVVGVALMEFAIFNRYDDIRNNFGRKLQITSEIDGCPHNSSDPWLR